MGQVSSKLRSYGTSGTSRGFAHWCPACEEAHIFVTERQPAGTGPQWTFNGDLTAPTFSPSMKITGVQTEKKDGEWTGEWVKDANGNPVPMCCHYILTAGQVQFCSDCTHSLKGQTVPLPDLPAYLRDP